MARTSKQEPAIKEFILRNIVDYPASIVAVTMKKFDRSRPTILRYIEKLLADGLISAAGNTYARRYELQPIVDITFTLMIDLLWTEGDIWRDRILPIMKDVKPNVVALCHHGFTEMLNNVIDHSESQTVDIHYRQTYSDISFVITDHGIGIFQKIQRDFKLDDPRTALLELSKGKLTSDRKNHAGEGIYFTSRMFDRFRIRSGNLYYSRLKRDGDDWLIERNTRTAIRSGTVVSLFIKTDADWTAKSVFEKYLGDSHKFRKTHVPLKLAQYEGEELVSRSQAKRILARFDNFAEVFLDFSGIDQIGQGFADEIFRVFHNANPKTVITVANTNPSIDRMINFVIQNSEK